MADFVATLRKPRTPTYLHNRHDGHFVAALRPRNLDRGNCDQPEMIPDMVASDDEVRDLLNARGFSNKQLTQLLRDSIMTLTRKLLTGREVARIDGQIRVSLCDDREPVLLVDLSSDEPRYHGCCTKSESCCTHSDVCATEERGKGYTHSVYPECRVSPLEEMTSLKAVHHLSLPRSRSSYMKIESLADMSVQPRGSFRRDSDADSGFGGKNMDEMDTDEYHDRAREVPRMSPSSQRSCPSVDSMCSILGPELRMTREPSCEKSVAAVSDAELDQEDISDDLDDESPALIIDESADTDVRPETPANEQGKSDNDRHVSRQAQEVTQAPDTPAFLTQNKDDHNMQEEDTTSGVGASYTSDQLLEVARLPMDLSGDSKCPIGVQTPLKLCSRSRGDSLTCCLCDAWLHDACELTHHGLYTHNLHTCPFCFMSYKTVFDLQQHECDQTNVTVGGARGNGRVTLPTTLTDIYHHVTSPERHTLTQDDTCGELLDLSMKKPQAVRDGEEGRAMTSGALSEQQGEDVSSDGYGKPCCNNVPLVVRDLTTTPVHVSEDGARFDDDKENMITIIKSEHPVDVQQHNNHHFHSHQLQQQVVTSSEKNFLIVPTIQSSQPGSPEVRSRSAEGRVPLVRSNSLLAGKNSRRYSPYTREKLAEVAVKFLATRREEKFTSGHSSTEARTQDSSNLATSKLNDGISSEASVSETTLKNRVNAFVKSGGHHGHVSGSPVHGCSTSSGDVQAVKTTAYKSARQRNDEKFICRQADCWQEFASFEALERHSESNHGRYLCEYCDKSFTARPNRDRHARYHTGERPYKCDLCPQAFFRGDDLKYHRTTRHPGAEPFVCKHCNRSFTWKKDLDRHTKHARCKVQPATTVQ